MKIGAAVGCFTTEHYAPPYEDAIRTIGEMGFDGLELIAFTSDDLKGYYTPERIRNLKSMIDGYGMQLSEFILYAYAVVGFLDPDPKVRQEALDFFKRGLDVAAEFGTDIINTVSNWPNEMTAPISYPPLWIHPNMNGYKLFDPKHRFNLPDDFDGRVIWDRYIDALRKVVEMCEQYKIRFALEGHANVVIGTTDGILRAFDHIPSPYFGTNFDAAWQEMQREYLPWSVSKLGEKIFHVHLRDTDGMLCYSYPVGQGIIDWNGFVRALKKVGFNGFLSMELGGMADPKKYVKESLDYMRRILKEEDAE